MKGRFVDWSGDNAFDLAGIRQLDRSLDCQPGQLAGKRSIA